MALTVGPASFRRLIRQTGRLRIAWARTSAVLLMALVSGLATQAIGVHLVLGVFVAGLVMGRAGREDPVSLNAIRQVGMGFFAPFFFAYTGVRADLTAITGEAVPAASASSHRGRPLPPERA